MLSFSTIVYSRDYPLLEFQARSMARFLDPADVASISVILNTVDEQDLRDRLADLLPAYGALQDRVRLVGGDEILMPPGRQSRTGLWERAYVNARFRIPFVRRQGWRGNNGYRLQQALKLASARIAGSDRLVILDTKNVFLRQVQETDFFTPDGRGKIALIEPRSDYHRNWLQQSLAALDVDRQCDEVGRTTTFATPFPVKREILMGLLDEIDRGYGSVQALFASRRRPSEFMLINAYCLKHLGGVEACFADSPPEYLGIWPDYTPDRLSEELNRLDDPEPLVLGLHNRAVACLSVEQKDALVAALDQRGISTPEQTDNILRRTEGLSR